MSVLQVGFGSSGGYTIGKSLRFRASGSAYLSRTLGTPSDNKKVTYRIFCKRGQISSANTQNLLGSVTGASTTTYAQFYFSTGNNLAFQEYSGGVLQCSVSTTALFRDPSAFYDVLLVVDTTQAVASNRVKIYVNGVLQTLTVSTAIGLNAATALNTSGYTSTIGSLVYGGSPVQFFDGYGSEVHLIDGQALDPSYFGKFDIYGVWQPKQYLGTYGTNGFYLPFSNGSSLANLTADASGNGNNWTANNISLTAGVTYDWMDDTPTNNYAVLNPLALHTNNGVISEANLRSNGTNGLGNTSRNASLTVSHKLYLETTMATGWVLSGSVGCFGFIPLGTVLGSSQSPSTVSGGVGLSVSSTNWTISRDNGGASVSLASFAGTAAGVVVQIAYDPANGNIWIGKNGTWYNSGNPETGMNPTLAGISSSAIVPVQNAYADATNTCNFQVNFGQRPFAYAPPSGFLPLCTRNAAVPAILDGDQHMETFTYLGNGGGLQVGEIQRNLEPYPVSKSLRFRASASAYLNRTPASTSNRKTWTWSGWIKRSELNRWMGLFEGAADTNNATMIAIEDGNRLIFRSRVAGVNTDQFGTVSLRNISDFVHIHCRVDTTQATAADRVRLYVGGIEVIYGGAYPAQNLDTFVNLTNQHYIGNEATTVSRYLDGYLSQVHFVDGQSLPPSDFGQTDGNGYWVPKQYTGTYGTNGFKLDFADTTSVATLGNDVSGNGNNWTVNNISLTAGATYDSMVDVPGNSYATMSPLYNTLSDTTLSDGNLKVTKAAATSAPKILATTPLPKSGKYYWEVKLVSQSGGGNYYSIIGISDNTATAGTGAFNRRGYFGTNDATLQGYLQSVTNNVGVNIPYGANYIAGDTIGVAFDSDTSTLTFYKNNVSQGNISGVPSTVNWYPSIIGDGTTNAHTWEVNFGQRPFAYTPPTGFLPLSENNIPLDTGNMEYPGLVWIKNRSASQNHAIFDVARGKQVYLSSNTTGLETTDVNSLLEFNKEGFLLGSSSAVNTLGNNYVAWAWKLPQTGVTNTAGSITSTVYANTLAGISAVSYAGTGANATVGHGLGVAPKMVIVKGRDTQSTTSHWPVYHSSLGNTSRIWLNLTNAAASDATYWNNTSPTSSVFTIGSEGAANENTRRYIAYCFAEVEGFSRIGSYTGNGNADGPFVYCGFRPGFVLVKRTDAAAGFWYIIDTTRNTGNLNSQRLYPNDPGAEGGPDTFGFDTVSNGFKVRNTDTSINASGGTYIFLAFAENPFKIARAR